MMPNTERLVQSLVELIRIPSVNPFNTPAGPGQREQELAEHLLARFEGLGLETGRREGTAGRPNVWGRLKGRGDGPSVMLAAHLDTVGTEGYAGAFEPQVRDGRVTGRGACDMKGALACYLEVIRMLSEGGVRLPGDVIVAGLVDEEHVQIGSLDMGRHGPHADYGIIGEPTGLRICPVHKGQLGVFIRTRGRGAHSSGPENGVNAVEHMGAVLQHLAGLNAELRERGPRHPLCGTGRFSVNVIRGGTVVSSIPDWCEIEADRRFLPGEDVQAILGDYRARLAELSAQLPDLRVEVSAEPSLLVPALDVPVDSPLVRALQTATAQVTGAAGEVAAFAGGTDAPNLGFPCVIFGPGALEQAHSSDEFVEVRQMEQASLVYLQTLLELNGLQGRHAPEPVPDD